MREMGCRSFPDSVSRADGAVVIVRLLRKYIDTLASRILGPFGKKLLLAKLLFNCIHTDKVVPAHI